MFHRSLTALLLTSALGLSSISLTAQAAQEETPAPQPSTGGASIEELIASGRKALGDGQNKDALAFFERATELDGDSLRLSS